MLFASLQQYGARVDVDWLTARSWLDVGELHRFVWGTIELGLSTPELVPFFSDVSGCYGSMGHCIHECIGSVRCGVHGKDLGKSDVLCGMLEPPLKLDLRIRDSP